MLPTPISYPKEKGRQRIFKSLRTRARITNLGVILLVSLASFSLLLNLHLLTPSHVSPNSILSTLSRDNGLESLSHLIIVPGHAIWTGGSAEHRLDENLWMLEPYQRNSGQLEAFYQHIVQAITLSLQDSKSLVVFSGGQTRPGTTTTEAESYLRLALQSGFFPMHATTENYALDSYQNLLFSIARFHEYTGAYPEKITVVGFEMKRRRFTDLHRVAIRWPRLRFEYIGIDSSNLDESAVAQEGENLSGYIPYTKDLYGCHSELRRKRRSRNRHFRFHPYHSSSPEISALMEYCPNNNMLYNGILPWT